MIDTTIYNYFKNRYPKIYEEAINIINQPCLKDITLIPKIYKTLWDESKVPKEERHYFFAVLINLYHPQWFTTGCKLKIGLRDVFAEAAGYANPEMVNDHTRRLDAYMKGKIFPKRVREETDRFLRTYCTNNK